MTNSLTLYRPSILELARGGNFRAIAYWINSLLAPYGIYIRAAMSRSGHLNILVDFQQTRRREFYIALRKHLVRFICYRLWTLNSEAIQDVRIVARIAGESDVLWKQSVRLVTPANREKRRRAEHLREVARRGVAWLKFQIFRSVIVSRFAFAGFFLCYWLLYWEMAGKYSADKSLEAMAFNAVQTTGQVVNAQEAPGQPSDKGQLRAVAPTPVPVENNLVQLGQTLESEIASNTATERFQGLTVSQVAPVNGEKVVALTFDDGPWPGTTEQVLDILKQFNIKGTFFWVGQALQQNPDIAKKVVAAGHAIGNHTWRHPMDDVDVPTAAEEIGNTAKLIYETTGVRTNLFRPPGGNMSGSMVPYAKQLKDIVTLWEVDSNDYYVSAPIIVDNVLTQVQPGGIILMHDGGGDRTQTVQALPQIITTLQRQGYRFVTVPELLAMGNPSDGAGKPPSTPTDAAPFNPVPGSSRDATDNPFNSPSPSPTPEASTLNPNPDANGNMPGIAPMAPTGVPSSNPSPGDGTVQPPLVPTPTIEHPLNLNGDMQGAPQIVPPTDPNPNQIPNLSEQMIGNSPQKAIASQPSG
ncbi:MAG: polysaccharide deacetylase family protein [Kovacikia sp.]